MQLGSLYVGAKFTRTDVDAGALYQIQAKANRIKCVRVGEYRDDGTKSVGKQNVFHFDETDDAYMLKPTLEVVHVITFREKRYKEKISSEEKEVVELLETLLDLVS